MTRIAFALLIASLALCFAPHCFANDVDPYAEINPPAPSTVPSSSGSLFSKWFGSKESKPVDDKASVIESSPAVEAAALARGPAQRASDLVVNALGLLGIGYRRGGNTPQSGFDCSGMVRYVFLNALGLDLPRRAEEISRVGTRVDRNELKPGDLVFYNTLKKTFSHVGIYLGDNRFIHAPASGGAVRVEDMGQSYWASRFSGARRVAD